MDDFAQRAKGTQEPIQIPIPLAEVLDLAKQGLGEVLRQVGKTFIQKVLELEVEHLVGERSKENADRQAYRWGTEEGYCLIDGEKVPIPRPRVRTRKGREVPLGSYHLFQKASLVEEAVWSKIMRGLTMRSYKEVLQHFAEAYGIEKSTVSEHFIEASRKKLDDLVGRKLDKLPLCAIFIDGTFFKREPLIVAIGLDLLGRKHVLGLRQGATENAAVVSDLLSDMQARGLDFSQPRLYVLDGSKALRAAVDRVAGRAAFIQRCQVHKIRNVMDHLIESHQPTIRMHMQAAFCNADYYHAKKSLLNLQERVSRMNYSAGQSLEEGLEDMLMLHKLGITGRLREVLCSTNMIESSFSVVDQICRRVKNWQGGDHRLRWAASALCYVESRWKRTKAYRQLPLLKTALQVQYEERMRQLVPSKRGKTAA